MTMSTRKKKVIGIERNEPFSSTSELNNILFGQCLVGACGDQIRPGKQNTRASCLNRMAMILIHSGCDQEVHGWSTIPLTVTLIRPGFFLRPGGVRPGPTQNVRTAFFGQKAITRRFILRRTTVKQKTHFIVGMNLVVWSGIRAP